MSTLELHYVEADVADHCNLSCAHCSHHSPYLKAGFYPLPAFACDVGALAKVARVKIFRLLGGEPFLNPNLLAYARAVRNSGVAERVGICTNGTLLDKADVAVFDEVDFIDINLYPSPPKLRKFILDGADAVMRRGHRCKVFFSEKTHFGINDLQSRIDSPELVQRIFSDCWIRHNCHAIYKGHFVRCMQIVRKPQFLAAIRCTDDLTALSDWTRDAVSLESPDLYDVLVRYIRSERMPQACSWCLGTSGRHVPHQMGHAKTPLPVFQPSWAAGR